ncbi:O-methyltransferase [Mangrovibacterium marinum]|uniref:Putative O-methyltransferase YrrM n=1 Tax=Mangrovibacterium marinum TaxID=1639118 RepID=A0A2T5C239_9BACT|nr:O-methyltransferase [Mangrovibacterium marinum]PTN08735.1 putative O-methyltransferase YrrM [Mangrovibacterium marinum]
MENNFELEKYIDDHSSPEDEVLYELNRETNISILRPRMLSGHIQGLLLEMLTTMIRPKRILEIGTFTGYSALCMAKGLSDDGILHTIELNDELEWIAQKYFAKAGLQDQIKQHIGDACQIIPTLNETFDFIFLDGNKREYCRYYELVFDKLRPGGYILADNILWDGKVVQEVDQRDSQTIGILEFNEMVKNDQRVRQVILPLRDGLSLIRKL